jgi:hypothetical protein
MDAARWPTVSALRAVDFEPRRYRLPCGALAATKVAALVAFAAAAACQLLAPPLTQRLADEASGIELRFPGGWHGNHVSLVLLEATALRGDSQAPGARMPPGPTRGCRIALERMRACDFEMVSRVLGGWELANDWNSCEEARLEAVAAYIGIHGPAEELTATRCRLSGRPAIMLSGPRYDGWGAVALADGPDLAFVHFFSPTRAGLRLLWPTWLAVVRSTRVRGPASILGGSWRGDPSE